MEISWESQIGVNFSQFPAQLHPGFKGMKCLSLWPQLWGLGRAVSYMTCPGPGGTAAGAQMWAHPEQGHIAQRHVQGVHTPRTPSGTRDVNVSGTEEIRLSCKQDECTSCITVLIL